MSDAFTGAFATSVTNVFATMLDMSVDVGQPVPKGDSGRSHEVSATISFSGGAEGRMVLGMDSATAERLVCLFIRGSAACGTPEFADAVGELANMISGGAKALFGICKCSISCPTVTVGQHKHEELRARPTIVLPVSTACGSFVVEVALSGLQESARAAA